MDHASLIRSIPDFPEPGILFRDITPLLLDAGACRAVTRDLAEWARPLEAEYLVAAESRGFIFGGALAQELDIGFIPARKPGKLPAETVSVEYELEYGLDALEEWLTTREVEQTRRRADRLLSSEAFPSPSGEWPALPWPLI